MSLCLSENVTNNHELGLLGRLTRRVKSGDRDGVAARLILEQFLNDTEKPAA